jgi:hypothetical protein
MRERETLSRTYKEAAGFRPRAVPPQGYQCNIETVCTRHRYTPTYTVRATCDPFANRETLSLIEEHTHSRSSLKRSRSHSHHTHRILVDVHAHIVEMFSLTHTLTLIVFTFTLTIT